MRHCLSALLLAFFTTLLVGEETVSTRNTILLEPIDPKRNRVVPLKVYLPMLSGPAPVVLFSHGLGGSRNNNAFLGNHWAEHGYVAVFMQHKGSDEDIWKSAALRDRMGTLKKAINLQSALDRFADVPFVIDQLEKWNTEAGHKLNGKLDLEHLGMSGHSYGAVTTQAMMGQKYPGNRNVSDPRIDAFLALSPSIHRTLSPEEAFGHITSPVLLMTGTKDSSPITPTTTPESRLKVYAALPPNDKYHLVFQDGGHHAFGDSGRLGRNRIAHHHSAIQTISTEFWDAYLKNDMEAKKLLQSEALRTESKLVAEDVWEWK